MHALARFALLACLVSLPAHAAEPARPQRPTQAQPVPLPMPMPRTAKERLSGKDSDEQRVNDCKVPPERRTRPRPTACPWDFGS